MRFWAQLNFADLAPYALAFGIAMPSAGLLQKFGGDEGGELARYVPARTLSNSSCAGGFRSTRTGRPSMMPNGCIVARC
jgi:hypothetical protein